MATASEIYGQIGAAKAFTSSVSNCLNLSSGTDEDELKRLKRKLEETPDDDQHKKIRRNLKRKIKRLERRNKLNNIQAKIAQGVTDFLTKICFYIDIGIVILIQWISKIIVMVLPGLEVSVKLLLLTNIKKMVSCSLDPRIPPEWRDPGVLINETMIDPRGILKASPYSKWGKYNYFGTFYDEYFSKARPTFALARAEDMNAFLWFAKNCAKFVSPNIVGDNLSQYFDVPEGATLFNTHEFKGKDAYQYLEGSTFKYQAESNTTFLCEQVDKRNDGTYYTIVPATDRWTGVTWYKDRTSITGLEKMDKINYNKSKPLFNIEYLGGSVPDTLYPDGNFRFRILPKPFSTAGGFVANLMNNVNTMSDIVNNGDLEEVIASGITNMPQYQFQGIQSPIPYTARFNEKGEYDKRGRYSINTIKFDVVEETKDLDGNLYFAIREIGGNLSDQGPIAYLKFIKAKKAFQLVRDTNQVELDISTISKILTECYTGNTVYEFNYDYVVSMKLFDAQEIATGIVDALMNVNIPNPFKKSRSSSPSVGGDPISNDDQIRIDAYVDKLVEKMIDTEDREFTDCFYTFSNEDYESMEQEVADKVINSTLVTDTSTDSIDEIYNIIDSYDGDATLEERVETISLALTKAANACGFTEVTTGSPGTTNESDYATSNGGKNSIQNFIKQAVQFLTSAIVNAILTPKVLMLLQVNRMMMGTYALPTKPGELEANYSLSVEDVLNGLSGLLKGIIREIINTIQKELLRLILERLSEMMAAFIKRLGLEYAMKWVLLLKQLLACFKRNKNRINGDYLNGYQYNDVINNIIDQVDYADIDTLVDEIMPNTNPC